MSRVVHAQLGLEVAGTISITIHHGESVAISADLSLFARGARLTAASCGDDFIEVPVAALALGGYLLGLAQQHLLGQDWKAVITR